MTTLHKAWPANKIIIYIDIDMEPLAAEYPDRGGVVDDGIGGGVGGDGGVDEIDVESDYEEEEDYENVEEGHNSRGCKAGITRETPWQRRQRLEREKTARGGVLAPSTRSGSAPQAAP
ncbi:hypothetical protein CMV_014298 [Castanea mollissima]|uniref:Uncharacterized protein n=1 Tax=Castanea mollissima TaxID=60419 RepID=A0A8J4VH81_9ROSI|nr:hypothetical protein CMV_014298 [Castanea mollissima]